MTARPLLRTVVHPPDALGRSELHCFLTKRGPLTQAPEVIEDLGRIPYHGYPEKSYETSGWLGDEGSRYLEVTMPNGRVLEVCAVAASVAEGDWPQRKEKKKRAPKKKPAKAAKASQPAKASKAAPPETPAERKRREYIQLSLEELL
jgi:hypothetical protein